MAFGKNKIWWAVMYPENMRDDWRDVISEKVQLPYAYCVHDKGLQMETVKEERKVHLHMMLVFPGGPTTYNHAMEVFLTLSAKGKKALNTCEPVYQVEKAYNYLIHDTEECRKQGKYQFDSAERITGNNFDIGAFRIVSVTDKNRAFDELTNFVLDNKIDNYAVFMSMIQLAYSEEWDLYRDIVKGYSGFFERLIRGQFFRNNDKGR